MLRMYLCLSVIVLMLCFYKTMYSGNVEIIYKNIMYHVNNDQSDQSKQLVMNALHELRMRVDALVAHLKTNRNESFMGQYNVKSSQVDHLCSIWSKKHMQIEELNKNYVTKKNVFAYNVNKGESISICVKNKNDLVNNINELLFVLLHELAHIMTSDYSHNETFWNSFRYLIKETESIGLYQNINYQNSPTEFCDLHIRHNPTF